MSICQIPKCNKVLGSKKYSLWGCRAPQLSVVSWFKFSFDEMIEPAKEESLSRAQTPVSVTTTFDISTSAR